VTGGEALSERQTHVLEIAAGTMEENNRRLIDYSGAIAQFNDVLTQATDLEEAPAWWVRPLDQLRADESDGGAAAKERSDNGESVHSSFRLSGWLSASEQWLAKEPGVLGHAELFERVRNLLDRGRAPRNSSRPGAERLDPWQVAKSGWPANSQHATPPDQPGQAVVLRAQLFTGDCRVAPAAFLVAGKRGHE
jgi:hypothetical protein